MRLTLNCALVCVAVSLGTIPYRRRQKRKKDRLPGRIGSLIRRASPGRSEGPRPGQTWSASTGRAMWRTAPWMSVKASPYPPLSSSPRTLNGKLAFPGKMRSVIEILSAFRLMETPASGTPPAGFRSVRTSSRSKPSMAVPSYSSASTGITAEQWPPGGAGNWRARLSRTIISGEQSCASALFLPIRRAGIGR